MIARYPASVGAGSIVWFPLVSIQSTSASAAMFDLIPARRLAATASLPWQPLAVHALNDRAGVVEAQLLSAVGLPCASRQGIGRKRCPVDWKTKLPDAGSVTVYRFTWQPAQSRGLATLAWVVSETSVSMFAPAGR